MSFPFSDAPNTAAIICRHILECDEKILYSSHDEDDGMWQFMCDRSHEISDARLVSLEEVLMLDGTIAQISAMPCGYIATRKSTTSEWKIKKR